MKSNWCLVASHGTVLFYLATHQDATIHEVADEGLLLVEKRGRRNAYQVNLEAPFRNPLRDVPLGEVVKLFHDFEPLRETA
jgi:hypothetical protein